MSDTPLTDGNRESMSLLQDEMIHITVPKTFARQLERQLNAANAKILELTAENKKLTDEIYSLKVDKIHSPVSIT